MSVELNNQKYIILNEYSEKKIYDLYLKIITEQGYSPSSLSTTIPEMKLFVMRFIENHPLRYYPSNYVWKGLENNYYLTKDYYRAIYLEVILDYLNYKLYYSM